MTDTSGRSGLCERCNGYGMVMLNGRRFLCWDHYCAEMQLTRLVIDSSKHAYDPEPEPACGQGTEERK